MPDPLDLRKFGLKVTEPRLKILDTFKNAPRHHLCAEDVYRQLLADQSHLGIATIHHILTRFEQVGLLTRHRFKSGKAVFEINEGQRHDHLICLQCGKVEEFHDPGIEGRHAKVAKDRGFLVARHTLHVYARCTKADCPSRNRH